MTSIAELIAGIKNGEPRAIGRAISIVEDGGVHGHSILAALDVERIEAATVVGLTGPPGAGKSTLTNQLIAHYRSQGKRIGIIAIDPSSPISGGALLGDRIRMMAHAPDQHVVVRSMATRGRLGGLCAAAGAAVRVMAGSGCNIVIIETVGVGQSEMDIVRLADITALVLAPGLGDDIQAMKAGLLEVADILVVNKADCPGAESLAMDLDGVVRERQKAPDNLIPKVCMTVASEGKGIGELAEEIARLDAACRASARHLLRRRQSQHLEILDWAMEMLRPRLLELISSETDDPVSDPRVKAMEILKKIN